MIKRFDVDEKTTRKYTATLKDLDGTPIPLVAVTTLVLTLYSLHSLAPVNSRNQQDVLNANNVTLHDLSGLLTWEMQPADNTILDTTLLVEIHRALFEWTWLGGQKAGKHEVDFYVRNLAKVT